MTATAYSVIVLAVITASCFQASIGFGLGMLAAPVIAIFDPQSLPGSVVLLAFVVTIAVVVRDRADLDVRGAGWALLGRIPGGFVGGYLIGGLSSQAMAIAVGVMVLLSVTFSLFGWVPRPRRPALIIAGVASGIFGTAFGIGGPPMALVWQDSEGARLRATMNAFFLVGSFFSIIALIVAGAITEASLQLSFWMLPALLVGYALSRIANRFLNKQRLKVIALVASTVGAVVLLVQQLF